MRKRNLTISSTDKHCYAGQTLDRNYTIPKRKREECETEIGTVGEVLAPAPVLQDAYVGGGGGGVVTPAYPAPLVAAPAAIFDRIQKAVMQCMEKPKTCAGMTCK